MREVNYDCLIYFKRRDQSELEVVKKFLVSNGLSKIDVSAGAIFDAEKHEAITQIKAPSKKMVGKIIDVVENGYLIGDKILRYPKVVVGN